MEPLKLLVKYALGYRGGRREHARRLFFVLARRFTPAVLVDEGPLRYYVSTSDDGIGWELFLKGSFDLEPTRRAYRLLAALGHAEFRDRIFVDVGANVGTATLHALSEAGFAGAVALEPDPGIYRLLRHNLLENGVESSVRALNAALSDRAGTVSLAVAPASPGTNRIVEGEAAASAPVGARVEVRCVTYDGLVEDGVLDPSRVGLVWIDTQGHEARVLAGAESLVASATPVVVDYWPEGLRAAGGLEAFESLVRARYASFADLRDAEPTPAALRPVRELGALRERYARGYTDLLLWKGQPDGRD